MMELLKDFYFVYVLYSEKDKKHYMGYTHHLNLRFEQHEKGMVASTKQRCPLKLIYFEACLNQQNVTRREKYFKTHYGRMYIKKMLQNYYANESSIRIPPGKV